MDLALNNQQRLIWLKTKQQQQTFDIFRTGDLPANGG